MTNKQTVDASAGVAARMPDAADRGTMPGGRAALPEGTLSTTYLGRQGDEQRDPRLGGPAPIPPAPVVEREIAPRANRTAMRPVARLQDVREGVITRARVGDTDIVLVRVGADIKAFGATCPHAGAPLDGGALCDGRLICPWHKAEFRISDGALLEPPALDGLARYAARVDGDTILVGDAALSATTAPRRRDGRTIAIVGSGAAGTAAAAELRRLGFDGRVLLIGPEAGPPYDRTALSKFVLSGDMAPDEVPPLRPEDWFASNKVEQVGASVSRIDAERKELHLGDGTILGYDCALLAVGAVARRPNLAGMTLRGVLTLRNRQDAAAIMAAAPADARVVVMGSSFIGLEAASALRKRGVRVTVVAPESIPFERQFGPEIGGMMQRLHESKGVAFRLGAEVASVEGIHAVDAVRLKDGETLPADLVLVGVGVEPATKGMEGIQVRPDGGVAVDDSFRVVDGLYAAGDCAAFPYRGELVRIEHWRVAQQQGRRAAAAMLGEAEAYDGVPFFWTYHYGQRLEYLGHATAWDRLHIEGDPDTQDFVALQIRDEHVVGAIACQRERATAALIDRMRKPLPVAEAVAMVRSAGGPTP